MYFLNRLLDMVKYYPFMLRSTAGKAAISKCMSKLVTLRRSTTLLPTLIGALAGVLCVIGYDFSLFFRSCLCLPDLWSLVFDVCRSGPVWSLSGPCLVPPGPPMILVGDPETSDPPIHVHFLKLLARDL